MHHSGFLFDIILKFFLLIFKCLYLCFQLCAYKPLVYFLAFSFVVFLCFWYTRIHLFLHKTGSTATFDIDYFTVANFDLMFYFIEMN